MAQLSQIKQLEERKRRLVAESERHRQAIAAEMENLQTAVSWVDTGYSVFRSVRSYWPLIAPAAGFFFGRKRGSSLVRLIGQGWMWFKLGKKVAAALTRRSPDSSPVEESS